MPPPRRRVSGKKRVTEIPNSLQSIIQASAIPQLDLSTLKHIQESVEAATNFSALAQNYSFAPLITAAWRNEPEKAELFVNASGAMTNLESFTGEMRSFADAVPQNYPPRQEVALKVAKLETTVSEMRVKVKESATKTEVRELREVVEDVTKLSTQLDNGRRLIVAMNQANQLFKAFAKSNEARIFGDDVISVVELMTPCRSEQDFGYKLGAFRSLLEVDLKFLKSFVRGEPGEKSVKLLRRWIMAEGRPDIAFDTFQDVLDICGVMSPFHPTREKIIEICEKHDQSYPPDYSWFWASLAGEVVYGS